MTETVATTDKSLQFRPEQLGPARWVLRWRNKAPMGAASRTFPTAGAARQWLREWRANDA